MRSRDFGRPESRSGVEGNGSKKRTVSLRYASPLCGPGEREKGPARGRRAKQSSAKGKRVVHARAASACRIEGFGASTGNLYKKCASTQRVGGDGTIRARGSEQRSPLP